MDETERTAPATCGDGPIWDVWLAAFHAPTLAIADGLGVFAALHARAASAEELGASLQIELRAVESMLGLLAALGFLACVDGRFHLTDVARHYLVPESPYYWGGLLQRVRDIPIDCNKLIAGLRQGTAAREARVSGELWRAPQPPPAALESFTHAMHAHSFALARRVMPVFALAGVERFLDVAGGSGSYSIAASLHDPRIRCTLLDLPVVCGVARSYLGKHGLGSRVELVAADMFADAWPRGFERVFFSDIFHDWDDERCRWLAARAYESLAPGGQVLVHEMLLADTKDGPLAAVAYSMVMVFVTEGRQRTGREITTILTSAGFVDVTVTLTSGGYALIAATRPAAA
jgi:cyclopropane fatty-acyl-phospholipid synthase-like methyltransferase